MRAIAVLLVFAVALAPACNRVLSVFGAGPPSNSTADGQKAVSHVSNDRVVPAGSASARGATMLEAYPRGRWRLLPRSELAQVVFWASHILIGHRDVRAIRDAPFTLTDWQPTDSPPSRSRDDALARARDLADRAHAKPAEFPDLARRFSDDQQTRDRGGSLGIISVGEWALLYPNVIDVLASLRTGEVSKVVETAFGFHVFWRQPPPKLESVSARRIVIGYDMAPFLSAFRRGTEQKRTRPEALEVAKRLAAEAQQAPERFAELAERYSEAEDGAEGGDIGVWSNHEVSPFRYELDAAIQMPIGVVSDPIDTQLGYQVLLRTNVENRQKYAATVVQLEFNPRAPAGDPSSKQAVRQHAAAIIARLLRSPQGIPESEGATTERWAQGRGWRSVTKPIEALAIGEVTREPIEVGAQYLVAKRLDPVALLPPPEPVFDLRSPAAPDLFYVAEVASKESFAEMLADARERATVVVGQRADCAKLHTELERAVSHDENEVSRVQHFRRAISELRECLGSEAFERYLVVLNQAVEEALLKPRGRR